MSEQPSGLARTPQPKSPRSGDRPTPFQRGSQAALPRVLELLGPSTGGIRRHVAALVDGLGEHGWSAAVAGPAGVMDGLGPQDAVVPVPGGFSPGPMLRSRRPLKGLVDDVEVVHAHGLKTGLLASTLRGAHPLVVTVHNLVLDEAAGRSAGLLRRLEARLPRRADRVIAVSPQIAERFAGLPGADRVVVIPPVAARPEVQRSRSEVRAALGVAETAPLVVCVARLHPQKDLPTLFRAADGLRGRIPNVRLAIVGTGPDEAELRRLVSELGLDDTVIFVGQSANAADEMAASDLVVVSSLWESGPLAVAEAMELARPVVSTPVGFVPRLVDDGVSGLLVEVGDPSALAAAMAALLEDPAAAEAMGRAAQQAVRRELDPQRLVGDVAAVYDELTSEVTSR